MPKDTVNFPTLLQSSNLVEEVRLLLENLKTDGTGEEAQLDFQVDLLDAADAQTRARVPELAGAGVSKIAVLRADLVSNAALRGDAVHMRAVCDAWAITTEDLFRFDHDDGEFNAYPVLPERISHALQRGHADVLTVLCERGLTLDMLRHPNLAAPLLCATTRGNRAAAFDTLLALGVTRDDIVNAEDVVEVAIHAKALTSLDCWRQHWGIALRDFPVDALDLALTRHIYARRDNAEDVRTLHDRYGLDTALLEQCTSTLKVLKSRARDVYEALTKKRARCSHAGARAAKCAKA